MFTRRSSSCHYVIFLVSQVLMFSLSLSINKTQVHKKNVYLQESYNRERELWVWDGIRLLVDFIFSLFYTKIDKHCVIEFSRWFFTYKYLSIASFWLRHTGALTLCGLKRLLFKASKSTFRHKKFLYLSL